jgi:uncharacterized membrane protein
MFAAVSRSRYFLVIILCAAFGAAVSGLSLRHHYQQDTSSFCNINATFDCDVVNRSSYSEVAGIPVALGGLLEYLLVLGLAMFQREKPETAALLMFLGLAGFAFSLYLTYVEGAVLRTWCLLCLGSLLSITLISLFSTLRVRQELRGEEV